ncbi:hypothetical protein [Microbacterium capsulatum]|uniref:Uncharacterized protein n=1 Tax=Microbacterium capsulatum TaxID=3041921 RepID=A0ABU0XME8_9MICO|nr:hypothetical protein [Microbacterium sp. ASV81]MDQ4215794.1 hypothetical protein [Microbacterium sp. ASV81]
MTHATEPSWATPRVMPTGSASRRRRAIVLLGIAVVVLACANAVVLGFVLLRHAPVDASTGSDVSAQAGGHGNPINGLAGEGGGGPGGPALPTPTIPTPTPWDEPTPPPVDPAAPSTPSDPSSPAPAPVAPAPPSTPAAPAAPAAPAPTAPAAPAPAPLAFLGLTENSTAGLFGIRIANGYTLSLSGQPGATATVTYGSSRAGSVRFDGAGHASITLGRSLVDLGTDDPLIRVAYSDGTPGAPIEARRSSL